MVSGFQKEYTEKTTEVFLYMYGAYKDSGQNKPESIYKIRQIYMIQFLQICLPSSYSLTRKMSFLIMQSS